MKLDLWLQKIKTKNLYMFPTLNKYMEEDATDITFDKEFQSLLTEHLQSLKDELFHYFPETVQISHSFSDKKSICGERGKCSWKLSRGVHRFIKQWLCKDWFRISSSKSILDKAIIQVSCFIRNNSSCHHTFSVHIYVWNRLCGEDDLRCALSTTLPQIDDLVKAKQYQPSH